MNEILGHKFDAGKCVYCQASEKAVQSFKTPCQKVVLSDDVSKGIQQIKFATESPKKQDKTNLFCPRCKKPTEPQWKICPDCGETLVFIEKNAINDSQATGVSVKIIKKIEMNGTGWFLRFIGVIIGLIAFPYIRTFWSGLFLGISGESSMPSALLQAQQPGFLDTVLGLTCSGLIVCGFFRIASNLCTVFTCSNCGTRIFHEKANVCPACRSNFSGTTTA